MISYKTFKKYSDDDGAQLWKYIKYLFQSVRRILKIPYHTYMCIKYPFLYPRNRFDGKYHAYMLSSFINKLRHKSIQEINITGKVITKIPETEINYISTDTFNAELSDDKQTITVWNNTDKQTFKVNRIVWGDKFEILNLNLNWGFLNTPIITIQVKVKDSNDKNNYGFSYHKIDLIKNKFIYKLHHIFKWIDTQILDRIFILPTYNEWEAVEPGWKKAFGKEYLNELRTQLKKDGLLYKFRIMQIKEKWGTFRLYFCNGSDKIHDIVNKYEHLSWNYCVKCGESSEVVSTGWTLPLCKKCADKSKVNYIKKEELIWD
jgi:hypothetical protein